MVGKIGLTTDVDHPIIHHTPESSLQYFVIPRDYP